MQGQKAYRQFWEKLSPAYPISKGEIRLPIATKPHKLPSDVLLQLLNELESLTNVILRDHGSHTAAVKRAKAANETALTPLITDEFTGVIRYDCVWRPTHNDIKILEINCDYPDGLVLHDATVSALTNRLHTTHQDLLLQLFQPDEDVTVLHSPNAFFTDGYHAEHILLQKRRASSHIVSNTVTIPSGHTVRRCLEVTKLTPLMISQLQTLNTRLVNTIALRTLGYKDLLESIDDPYIPETFSVTTQNYNRCLTDQENWILKPVDGCEGYGVYFGNKETSDSWRDLVHTALKKNYIAQEFVSLPKVQVEMFDDGEIVSKEVYYDLCPHFFIVDGKVTGRGHTLVRYSENPVVNVSQGGGIGYYLAEI